MSVTNQLKHRLASLAAAGVEFVPAASPVRFELPLAPPPVVEAPDLLADNARQLAVLADEVSRCKKCPELYATRTQTVFGVGPANPEICFIGEAPGADEDRQGEPFVGAAGILLNKILDAAGLRRDEVYICNVLKCRPPNNRPPEAEECRNCRPYLDRQLELLRPKVLLCLGGVAAKNLLGTKTGITRLRGQLLEYNGIPTVCTYHPAYILRLKGDEERKAKRECWDDVKLMLKQVGREVPKK